MPGIGLPILSGAAGQHRAAGFPSGPVRAFGCVALAAGLVVVGPAHDIEQFVDRRVIALVRGVDGLLRKVVAQHEPGVDGIHALSSKVI